MKKNILIARRMCIVTLLLMGLFSFVANAQFSHPGIQHKQSDIERMRYGIEKDLEPWTSSYANLAADAFSQYSYDVKGDATMTVVSRGSTNASAYEKDMTAAYQNALMWCLTDDQRHADKAIEILNAWSNLTSVLGIPLNVGLYIAPMVNAAELIKHSNAGWTEADMQKFSDMLVYPGYSSTTILQSDLDVDNHTFYWGVYNGDPKRAGNQELAAYKGMMAIGIFLDNDTIYDRAFRYVSGQKHRPDDLPYESGPKTSTSQLTNNGYRISYDYTQQYTIEDYGYDGVLTNYIYDNGQSQESSRDQTHAMYGVSLLSQIAEVAWNQGDDLYSLADNRILTGLEYHLKYNLSYENTYQDQTEPWEPSIEAGEFYQVYSRTARLKSLQINPYLDSNFDRISRGVNITRPYWEMPLNHYKRCTNIDSEDYKWLQRARDLNIKKTGKYEVRSESYTDHPGWGALTFTKPEGCAGDPISNIIDDIPIYGIPHISDTIEAENFDFFAANGEGLVYHDVDTGNTPGFYRLDESVDIDTCSEGGYMLSNLEDGEWLTYTIVVPQSGLFNLSIRYAAAKAGAKIKFSVAGIDICSEVSVPFDGDYSTSLNDWKDYTIGNNVILKEGVQALRIHISGSSNAFVLNSFVITEVSNNSCSNGLEEISIPTNISEGINYSLYQGAWDSLPDFSILTPIETGITESINLFNTLPSDSFALVFSGYIDIPMDGSYTFYTLSDGASRLYIDGNLIVDNVGENEEVSGNECIDKGDHAIRVEYCKSTRDEVFSVSFAAGSNGSKRDVDGIFAEKRNQTISFEALEKELGDADFNPGAIASSGLPVYYVSYNLDVATIVNNKIHLVGTGTVPIVAIQDGNYLYNLAKVVQYLKVNKKSASINSSSVKEISLYPNPVKDVLNFDLEKRTSAEIEIVDFLGKTLLSRSIEASVNSIDISQLAAGVYIVRFLSDGLDAKYRIVKK